MNVLIADTSRHSRLTLELALGNQGHRLVSLRDFDTTFHTVLATHVFDMAIVDWLLPHHHSEAVCRALRARAARERPYIVVVTSLGPRTVLRALQAGADACFLRPLHAEDVIAATAHAEETVSTRRRLHQISSEVAGMATRVKAHVQTPASISVHPYAPAISVPQRAS